MHFGLGRSPSHVFPLRCRLCGAALLFGAGRLFFCRWVQLAATATLPTLTFQQHAGAAGRVKASVSRPDKGPAPASGMGLAGPSMGTERAAATEAPVGSSDVPAGDALAFPDPSKAADRPSRGRTNRTGRPPAHAEGACVSPPRVLHNCWAVIKYVRTLAVFCFFSWKGIQVHDRRQPLFCVSWLCTPV